MIKVGVFFGGQSREREISFASGRTVYDNLDKSIFDAVPIFVDSLGNFILIDWKFIYKGTIRDFYPAEAFYPEEEKTFQLYIESLASGDGFDLDKCIAEIGRKISPQNFTSFFDIAFLALHGPFGEDGNIQGLLEWYNIPYTGSGIYASAAGADKLLQKSIIWANGFPIPEYFPVNRGEWLKADSESKNAIFGKLKSLLGLPFVIKSPMQGSSIGVTVLKEDNFTLFHNAINKSFFIEEISKKDWVSFDAKAKHQFVTELCDIRSGIGLPVFIKVPGREGTMVYKPSVLMATIETEFDAGSEKIVLESIHGEETVIIEKFIEGTEFSCIVIQGLDNNPISLPPTQIIKQNEMFDYRAKYLPGITRKVTPIDLPFPFIERIREDCAKLYKVLDCQVYARIDGFFAHDGSIYLNDPNTTSGMMPSSFFFHQAAEIGLAPSPFLTYILFSSLQSRLKSGKNIHKTQHLLSLLENAISISQTKNKSKIKVAVIMGGYSTERHISVESGRNIYEKLASSDKYLPTPIFLTGNSENMELYKMPLNTMLKDNADDIKEKIFHLLENKEIHPAIEGIIEETSAITFKFTHEHMIFPQKLSFEELSAEFDKVFIALHGRPGEDGKIQTELEKYKLPYNGSGPESSSITINKYATNKLLGENGFLVAKHFLAEKDKFLSDKIGFLNEIESGFEYPFIAKPHDEGCSSAVKKIHGRNELEAYAEVTFRDGTGFPENAAKVLGLQYHEEFPQKTCFLIEELISKNDATHFLEVTGGMLTKMDSSGSLVYEFFEPSETLASGDILTLEEKFLAGEGQNITPARFSAVQEIQQAISKEVRITLEKVARILNVRGYCRIDAFVRIYSPDRIEVIIIEINSLPGMTPATCIFHQAGLNGYTPYSFIDMILTEANK